MSEKSSTAIGIPDHRDSHIKQETQYGVVWPDGTHTWQTISRGAGGTPPIIIAALVPDADTSTCNTPSVEWSPSYWTELLETRAGAARLDVEVYRDMHHFIKRTVVLSVTATEEV